MLRTLLSATLLALPATALAWPASGDWDALTIGADITDDAEDQASSVGENAWDIVGDSAVPAVHWYLDDENIYVRFFLNEDPSTISIPYTGTWGILFETDGNDTNYEHHVSLGSGGASIVFYENTDGGTGAGDTAETGLYSISSPFSSGLAEVFNTTVPYFGSEADAYLNLAIPLQDLYDNNIIDENTTFQLCAATSDDGDSSTFDSDTAGTNNSSGIGDLPSCLADPISVDGDYDGLTWFEEIDEWGTDPTLADSDHDNLDDGDEVDMQDIGGCPDPMDDDSDGDSLLDGDEVHSHGTDPCNVDSDGDNLSDSDELEMGLDPTEEDSDGDGIGDYDEVNCDQGTGGDPDDRDGDGISDSTENSVEEDWQDYDDDGHPNWCDTDSDGDGLDDSEEYGEDDDCDEENDWLDDYDDDLCPDDSDTDEPDTDTDTDADTDTDGDTDTDALCDSGEVYCGGKLTGGGCNTPPGALLLIPALLGALLIGVRRFGAGAASLLLGGLTLLFLSPSAKAQGLDAQSLNPSVDGERLLVLDDAVLAPEKATQPGGGLMFNYAVRPVVYRLDDGGEQSVVDGLGTLNALVFFRLASRLRLGMDLPINPVVTGEGVVGGHLLGDIALDTKVTMLDRRDGLGLSASARLALPTGSPDAWVGQGGLTARALLGASTTVGFPGNPEALVLAANAGLATGSDALDEAFDLHWGMRMPFGVGASFAFAPPVWAAAELSGAWVMANSEQPGALPLEALLSLRLRPVAKSDLLVTLGGGLPLSQGVGNPDLRGLAGLAWVPRARKVRTWNLPPAEVAEPTPPPPDVKPIPQGMGRIAVTAQRSVDGKPEPVRATVLVLGRIASINAKGYKPGVLPPPPATCGPQGRTAIDLPPGEYTVRVVATNLQPSTTTVTVRAGHALPLAVDLKPGGDDWFTTTQGGVELLPGRRSVRFEAGSTGLSTDALDQLARLSAWYTDNLVNTHIQIVGWADPKELKGGEMVHEQRAAAVKAALDMPKGYTHCVTVVETGCDEEQNPASCRKATIEITDMVCYTPQRQ